jgi:hypothetical protein
MKTGRGALAFCYVLIASCHREGTSRDNPFPAARDSSAGATGKEQDLAIYDAGPEGDAAGVRGDVLAMAPILEQDRGRRAVKSYLGFLSHFCALLTHAGSQAPKLKSNVGLGGDADPLMLCPGARAAVKALASGAFSEPGADEVLLEVPSGQDRAAGEATLAMMHADGNRYRLIRHMLRGNQFEVRLRLLMPSRPDVWMVCRSSGSQGTYPSVCGFLGQGSFGDGADAEDRADPDAVPLVSVTTCGSATSVQLGGMALQDRRLSVGLVVRESLREPNGPDESSSEYCSKETPLKETRFTMVYAVDMPGRNGRAKMRRVTPIPPAVTKVVARY